VSWGIITFLELAITTIFTPRQETKMIPITPFFSSLDATELPPTPLGA